MQRFVITLINVYQRWISPVLPPRCRFEPTCSSYALQAVERFGIAEGSILAVKRLCRCHPWHEAGYDPCPDSCTSVSSDPTVHKTTEIKGN